jgi:hypothetical protein
MKRNNQNSSLIDAILNKTESIMLVLSDGPVLHGPVQG